MSGTTAFYDWFFNGLQGLGGWFIFFLIGLAGFIWLYYDSQQRRLPVLGWRLGVTLLLALILPSLYFRLSGSEQQTSLDAFKETIFYLGLLGGLLPPALAIGYFFTYRGMVGCPNGHIYESVLGRCPYDQPAYTPSPPAPPVPVINDQPLPRQTIETKKLANAWLVSGEGHNYQLNQGITSIGRSSQNDIQLADMGISKMHARIHEENGHFRILDVGSTYGVYINSHRIRQETMLESGDSIKLSDNTTVQFVTAPR